MEHPKLYENIMKDKDVISALDYLRERQHGIRTFNLIDMLQKEIPKKDKELTKYKRTFEILKDNTQISIKNCLWDYLVINQENGGQIQFRLSKEEKELLEELMKSEEIR